MSPRANAPHVVRNAGKRLAYIADPELYESQQTVAAFDERAYAHPFPSKEAAEAWIEARRQDGAGMTLWSEPASGAAEVAP